MTSIREEERRDRAIAQAIADGLKTLPPPYLDHFKLYPDNHRMWMERARDLLSPKPRRRHKTSHSEASEN